MTTNGTIKYCTYPEIDLSKWDRCIKQADNGLIYAHSFYLDIMAGKWHALVLNDYEAVLPLTWNRKYGFYYLYQPFFMPALGVFGKKLQPSTVLNFFNAIPTKYRYWDINLNEANILSENDNDLGLSITTRLNHFLNLDKSYREIKSDYKRLCLRMLKKAEHHLVRIDRNGKPLDVIEFYRQLYKKKHANISSGIYEKLIVAATTCWDKGQAKIYLAKLPDGEVTASYLILYDKNFVYSLIGGSSEKGKQTGSFYLLTDAAIKDHAETKRLFRFEGSDLPGIALFDSQFGPDITSYQNIKRNKLPFPLNLLKR
ncbi:MAG: hypothetical protein ABJA85_05690 [Bacteroidota bacterium]